MARVIVLAAGTSKWQFHCLGMPRTNLADLTPLQIAIVSAIFILTLLGAIVAALAFRWWNTRQRAATIDPRGKGIACHPM